MASNRAIDIVIKATDKASAELRTVSGEVKKLGAEAKTASDGTEKIGSALRGMGREALIMGAAVAGVAAALYKMGEAGAVVTQTTESFDMLMNNLGAAPDILAQMTAAVGGTVSEMDLMSATMTLVAGASSELAISMVNAAPQLLEIAKAANKLNPSLGSTTFLYESLARGIKRSSPLILDNTGLVIKVGEANEAYAASLGVTVEALTATDKQQALLNAALAAGEVLIDQVGGNTESATDAFARFKVEIKETANEISQELAPAVGEIVGSLGDFLRVARENRDELDMMADAYGANEVHMALMNGTIGDLTTRYNIATGAMADYRARMADVDLSNVQVVESSDRVFFAVGSMAGGISNAGSAFDAMEREARSAALATLEAEQAARDMADAATDLAAALYDVDVSTKGMWKAMSEAAIAAGATDTEIVQLALDTGLVSEAEARATVASNALITSVENASISYGNQVSALEHLANWQQLAADSANFLQDGEVALAASAAAAAERELALAESLIGTSGAATEAQGATEKYSGALAEVPTAVDTKITQTGMTTAQNRTGAYLTMLANIPTEKRTRIIQEYISSRTSDVAVGGGTPDVPGRAAGTPYVAQTGLAYLHQGEAVLPRNEARNYRDGGGGGTVVIAPIILERGDYTDANGDIMFEQIAEMIQAQQGAF
ncbi:MAG TPA: hypothetical protein VMV87_16225 [Burkholderiales bacterium]|nr:hypothetical protein [Burkholderiales bacterium]